ncbi:MAG: amino acid ABC transporter permease [Candidatus Promineifilaceae bacterium]|nr:amino acid ABC transporter permease [Candidatus Promineifilaceae bacterium]
MATPEAELTPMPGRARVPANYLHRVKKWPWWLIAAIALGILIVYNIAVNPITRRAFWFVSGQEPELISVGALVLEGIFLTLYITFIAFIIAMIIGLIMGLGRVSENVLVYNLASFYVEMIRGIPMLVLVYAIAFVGVSEFLKAVHFFASLLVAVGVDGAAVLLEITSRDISNVWRGIFALAIGYGAFLAEVFRAGIESIERGQMEAARALGMSYLQAMRYIILPQAVRRVLPALGNDFVSMLKDSALVSVLGVQEMTQLNKLYVNSTFNFVQGFVVLAFLYLSMTIALSRLVRLMETRMSRSA